MLLIIYIWYKMKNIIPVLIVSVIIGCASVKEIPKFSKVIQETYINDELVSKDIMFMNESGQFERQIKYKPADILKKETRFIVDSLGNTLGMTSIDYDNGNIKNEKTKYFSDFEYNDNGKIIKRYQFDKKEEKYLYETYEYDSEGREILKVHYNQKGEITKRTYTEYGDEENIQKVYKPDSTLIQRTVTIFDGEKQISRITTDANGKEQRKNLNIYDGDKIVKTQFYKDSLLYSENVLLYNDEEKILSYQNTTYQPQKTIQTGKNIYEGNKLIKTEIIRNDSVSIISYYEYYD